MKKIIFLIVFTIGGWQHTLAQVATNSGSGLAGTYESLSAAITALNAATITSPVVITLTGNETSPAGGYNITATGTSVNTITIAGSSSTITAPTPQASGILVDALFKITGGDYITIQNFTMQENASNTVTTAAANTMTEFGVALFYATTTNGAQNCTIQNNTITLNRTYQNTFGIYSNSTHSATDITTSATASSAAGSNFGLKVYGNAISNINFGLVIIGPTAAANHNTGIDIGGTASGTGNTISDFGTTGTFSAYANMPTTSSINGILVRNSKGFNVSYNNITSSNGGVSTTGATSTLRGVFIPIFSAIPTGTFTNTINNNTIALTHGATSGVIQGITVQLNTGNGASTQNINNNNFTALGSSRATAALTITAIFNTMANFVNNFNGNTFTNITSNTTSDFTFFAYGYTMPADGSQTFDGNSIVTAFSKTGAGGTVTVATSANTSPNGTFHTFTNNNFSNITVTGSTGITGSAIAETAGSATRTVTGNTFNNWTGGTGAIIGITYSHIGGTTSTISNNTLTNITGQGSLTGINIGSGSLATTLNVANNTISNLTGGSVTGLACTNASTTVNINGNTINTLSATAVASTTTALSIGGGATTNVFQNKMYNISGTHASSTVRGILISAGLNINIYNNLIGDLTAPAASGTDVIRGIIITSTTALSTHKIYSNTIYLNAASSGTNFGGSGIYHTVNATSTTAALDLQNNIIINGLTPKGTGLAVAFRRSAGAANNLANYAATSDKNLFYAGTPSASNLIYSDGTSSAQTMAEYKAGVFTAGTIAPRDANSFTEAWTSSNFESVTGSSANYLQPATIFFTQAESGGNTIALTSPDYNNVVRPGLGGTGYDIGAWEFSVTVTYDSQGGTAIANGSTTTGGSIATSPGTPTRTGYTFNGWFTASSGGSAISFPYTHGQTANFTLYAQWTATYIITVTAGAGGTISPGTGVVNAGSNNTYTITPDAGYLISDVTVDGTSATALTTGSYAAAGTYVFTDVQANHTIGVTFALACTNVGLASATATASPICANATTTLTYSGLTGTNAAVTWTQNADGTGTTYGTGTPSSAVGPGTYYAYATGDCGSAISIAVTVATKPANAGADASTCGNPDSSYNLLYQNATASEGTVSWSSSGDGEFQYLTGSGPYTDLSPLYRIGPTDIINGSAIITLNVTGVNNCVTTDSFTLTLVPPPTAIIDPIIVNPWDELHVCAGGSYLFSNAVIAEGANIYWYRSGDGSFNNDSIQNPIYTPGPQDIADGYVYINLNVSSYGETSCDNRVSVRLVIDPYPIITASAVTNGSISSPGVTNMSCDGKEDKTYTITPDAGYSISDVTVDGNSAAALTTGSYALGGTYVFTDVQVNHTISVTFALACSNVGLASATATASPICANATTTLTYSGLTGTNAAVTWTQNADGTGTTYGTGTPSNAVGPGTYYAYAKGDCGSAISTQVVVVGNALPATPTITAGGATTLCSGGSVVLTASAGTTYLWSNGATTQAITVTTAGNYTVQVTASNGCRSAASAVTEVRVTTTWTGALSKAWNTAGNWSCGAVPDIISDVTIAAATNQPIISSDVVIRTVTLNTGTSLAVSTGFNLTLTNYIYNLGTLTIENNANLIQTALANTNSGSGTAIVKRNSSSLFLSDYTLWSSPVANQNLLDFSPLTVAKRFYDYDSAYGAYGAYSTIANPAATNFTVGKGYLIRMPNNANATTAAAYPGVFTGILNNGDVPVTLISGDANHSYNLVGNPYPSPITISTFLTDNSSSIESTLYFWRKTNGIGTAYCTLTSGVFTTNNNSKSVNPNGIIQTGQGFFVVAKPSATSLTFKNGQRAANTVGQFFKTKQVTAASRIWLNATNAIGSFSQMALNYTQEATFEKDDFDGKYINDNAFALTSNINNEEYTIQGRPTFDPSDVVALNFKTDVAGDYTIALDHSDGVFAMGQDVYLADAKTGTETNLKTDAYTFTAATGTDNSRFTLKYQKTLKVDAPSFNENTVTVYKNNGVLQVKSGLNAIDSIKVFDINGRLIAQQNQVNANSSTIENLRANEQVLIVQVTSEDNKVVNKKVIN